MNFEITYKRMAQSLLVVGPFASLSVSPWTNFDPISLVKLLFITSIAFMCFALILNSYKNSVRRLDKSLLLTGLIFIVAMLSTILFSGAPLGQQVWGSFGRNTGFLTYFSLIVILFATALIQKIDFYNRLLLSLVLTAIPMTIYCLIQVAGMDPIAWSEKHPFGTLGNINFSSAFFGLSSIVSTVLILEKKIPITFRILLALMVVIDLGIVYGTGSIQGLMMFIAGVGLALYMYIRSNRKLRILKFPYLILVFCGTVLTIMGLSNKGPLSKFLFAPSIVFRTDYWHAGWQMTLDHPFFGVGMDSYGDWYRSARGLVSTLRTGPDRVANTAHNIFLDISSNGGLPLITAYILINLIALRAAIRILKSESNFDPYFVALFSSWFGYLIFSAISINQVGVGIWGWLLTGALIGFEISKRNSSTESQASKKNFRKNKGAQLSAGGGALALLGFVVGFLLALVPFNADVKFKTALQTRDMSKIIPTTQGLGATAFYSEYALDMALKNNLAAQSRELTKQLNLKYPNDYMGWKSLSLLADRTLEENSEAIKRLSELDPFNPTNPKS